MIEYATVFGNWKIIMGMKTFIHNNGHENINETLFIFGKVKELTSAYLP